MSGNRDKRELRKAEENLNPAAADDTQSRSGAASGVPERVEIGEPEDAEVVECLRFIERVRQDSPNCLAGLTSLSPSKSRGSAGPHQPSSSTSQVEDRWLATDGDLPAQIGRFRILEQLGEGGFGLVFLAHDPRLDRQVALKVPRVETLVTNETRDRFLREAKAAARLDHRNIATLFEAGQIGPICFIVSAFCAGGSLAELMHSRSVADQATPPGDACPLLEYRTAAELIIALAHGVQHAHDRGILHRDLKPGNILFDTAQRLSEGDMPLPRDLATTARIVDFGLAKYLDDSEGRTRTGAALGTANYMSPEQAHGDLARIGPATDIYSLGAILYELLTGRPPFRKRSAIATMVAVKNDQPVAPRRLLATCPRDLEAICLKCLEKDPTRRYDSAAALAADLQRFLRGETVVARSPSHVTRGWRWCRRYPVAAALLGLLATLAILGPLVAFEQRRLYQEARVARDDARHALYTADMNLAMRDWDDANLERCGELLRRHLPQSGARDYRGFEWFYLWRLFQATEQATVILHDDMLESIALSPDETLLAVGRYDGRLYLWDLQERRRVAEWRAHPYRTFSLRFSHDGQTLASASVDSEVKVWDVATQAERASLQGSRSVAFSPRGTLAYRCDTAIGILGPATPEPRFIQSEHAAGVGSVVFSPDGQSLASAGWDGSVQIWDTSRSVCRLRSADDSSPVWMIDWSPNGDLIATADVDGMLRIREASTLSELRSIRAHAATVNVLTFSPDASLLASGSVDNTVRVWKVSTGRMMKEIRGHRGEVTSLAFADMGRALITGSVDGDVRRWELDTALHTRDVLPHPGAATSASFSPDGRLLATGCSDGRARLWQAATGRLLDVLEAHDGACWRVEFLDNAEESLLVSSGEDGVVRTWDPRSGKMRHEFIGSSRWHVRLPVAVSRDGSLLAFADSEYSVQVQDLRQGREVCGVICGRPHGIGFSHDARHLLVIEGNSLSAWTLPSGELACKESTGLRELTSLALLPEGNTVAVGSYDRTVQLWKLESHEERCRLLNHRTLNGPAGSVWSIAYTSSGSLLASSGDDRVIRLWDAVSGEQRAALTGHTASVADLTFSPDGQTLASACDDHTVRLWRGPTESDGSSAGRANK